MQDSFRNTVRSRGRTRTRQAGLEPTTLGLEGRSRFVQPLTPPFSACVIASASKPDQSSPSQPVAAVFKKFVPALSPHLRPIAGGADDLLKVRDVAAKLGLSTATVYALCERGELPHVRVSNAIRVAPADLEAFIARGRSRGPGAA